MDSSFSFSDRNFSAFWVVLSAKYVVIFIGRKYLLDSEQLLLIFTKVGSKMFLRPGKTLRQHVSFYIS